MPDAPAWGWKNDHPVVNMKWEDADAYAKWAGTVLPTEAQWEKAASWDDRKKQKRKFPWGEDFNSSLLWCSKDKRADAGSTAPAGAFQAGSSPYGILDMAGNVYEWCADWYFENIYKIAPKHNPVGQGSSYRRVLRGGTWFDNSQDHFRSAHRYGGAHTHGFNGGGSVASCLRDKHQEMPAEVQSNKEMR